MAAALAAAAAAATSLLTNHCISITLGTLHRVSCSPVKLLPPSPPHEQEPKPKQDRRPRNPHHHKHPNHRSRIVEELTPPTARAPTPIVQASRRVPDNLRNSVDHTVAVRGDEPGGDRRGSGGDDLSSRVGRRDADGVGHRGGDDSARTNGGCAVRECE